MKPFPELEALLEDKFDGIVTMVFEPRACDGKTWDVVDSFVSAHGFRPLHNRWNLIDEATAIAMISEMLHRSLAYRVEMMSEKTAAHCAEAFRELFDRFSITCVSNGYINADGMGWTPITDSTFEMAVAIYDANNIGMICVEDED
ncbi:hypothetical protein SAMN02745166_03554 [Prosthecobacter debontii]|uniref:Uncharacterized protein n=1 Tax=Prosthecobacter debontii TaxID=48467 RepID=A0A1T4YK30_9BACT|nr:hypothetical protein [Prosthecobacter debontii]SKB02132.1 hypothetical protein SAMN02745166_03554 [Prosthecobacter debontii]